MKVTLTKKNKYHMIDVFRKFFKYNNIAIIDFSDDIKEYEVIEKGSIISIDGTEVTYDQSGIDILVYYNYLKDPIIKFYHIYLPYNSKIELKGSKIIFRPLDLGNIKNWKSIMILTKSMPKC